MKARRKPYLTLTLKHVALLPPPDPEPLLDWRQQRSITCAGLRCVLRHCDSLYDTSPPLCQRGFRFPRRAESHESHGTGSHGQPVWRVSWYPWGHQHLRSQHGPGPQVLQHRCFANEGQRAQCRHILGHMMRWYGRSGEGDAET